jgi:chemotaxis protein methyltransferase CheR
VSVDSLQATLPAPPGTAGLLSALIHETTGIHFDSDRYDLLLEKLEPLVLARGCSSYLEYYYLLKYWENGDADWMRVADALSVQETYFWREIGQVQALVKEIVPAWFARTSLPLRIWCAACATGEEPYSIVMALEEAGLGHHSVEIYGSDASASALEKARNGLFRDKSFRSLPLGYRQKYFLPEAEGWRLKPKFMERVQFQRANLLAPEEINFLARSPVVFCRNVFIYFSRHAIRQTLATLAARMPSGGYLFVGAAESLLKLTLEFELREMEGAFVYVRV